MVRMFSDTDTPSSMRVYNQSAAAGLLVIAVTALPAGCSSARHQDAEATADTDAVSIVPGESPSEAAQVKMLAAKDALFTRLSARLMEVLGNQGPATAIAVCQNEAVEIAEAVSEQQGVRIGRTGVRLRNPDNAAPSWAEPLVRKRTDVPTFVTLSNGDAAALLPIKLQGQCVMCHGPPAQIAPAIQDQLDKRYPTDRATGFREGELRGWFWVELPRG